MAINYAKEQAALLLNHLLRWLPSFELALRFSGSPFYKALGDMTVSLVSDHTAALLVEGCLRQQDWELPSGPTILNDPQTNLKKIARFLATPPHCGFFMGREAIAEIARKVELPRGFGGRQQMMGNLLGSASQYGTIPELLLELAAYAQRWHEGYLLHSEDHPHLAGWIHPWAKRAQETAVSIVQMRRLALEAV